MWKYVEFNQCLGRRLTQIQKINTRKLQVYLSFKKRNRCNPSPSSDSRVHQHAHAHTLSLSHAQTTQHVSCVTKESRTFQPLYERYDPAAPNLNFMSKWTDVHCCLQASDSRSSLGSSACRHLARWGGVCRHVWIEYRTNSFLASAPGSGRELNSRPIMFCFTSVLQGCKEIRIDTYLIRCTHLHTQMDLCLTKCGMTLTLPCSFCSSLCKVRRIIVFRNLSIWNPYISLRFTEVQASRHYEGSEGIVHIIINKIVDGGGQLASKRS
jgi:hypothetical protein